MENLSATDDIVMKNTNQSKIDSWLELPIHNSIKQMIEANNLDKV